jgi:hypothetical protein
MIAGAALLRLQPSFGQQANPTATTTATAAAKKLPPVHLDGQYFTRDGKRFLPVGAHWVPAKAAMQWPVQWDPKDIEADFAKMHELGYSIVRFDMMWAWFEPRPGDYNPVAFQQLDYLVSLAHKYQIYLHPSLFIGGEVGEAYWDVPWRHGRHPHSDPEMLRLETNLAAEFGRRYANETGIIGWDLTDEPPFWIVQTQTTDAMAVAKTNFTLLSSEPAEKKSAMGHSVPTTLRKKLISSACIPSPFTTPIFFPTPCSPSAEPMARPSRLRCRAAPGVLP